MGFKSLLYLFYKKISFQTFEVVQKFVDDVYFGLCSNEFLLDITYELANVFGMLGEDPGDEGYEDPYDEEGSTVQTIILPGNDMVTNTKPGCLL